ncbi:hypothetical protein HELRODRAFT_62664, partial [Helobdella robusta]|uniref:Uncharacterized protein n=1 Tax=Helobdella robusta TaxID=6412 RepID=T1FX33_HELRO
CGESVCEPSYGNLLIGREKNLTASSTCGTKGQEKYCVVSHLDKDKPNNQKARTFKNCFICDSRQPYSVDNKKSHLIENVLQTKELDKNKWWQSKYGEHSVYVQFDLEAEFHFLYLHFQCKTLLPAAMLVERSNNFGRTWRVDRYFSEDCERDFPRVPTYSSDFRVPYCTNEFSESPNKLNREVLLTILPPDFKDPNPYREEILDILRMTNIRINFTRLHMLGDQYLSLDAKRNYYYTIYNMVVRGRCSCYGHSNKCIPLPWQKNITDAVYGQCECTHHTTGYNCERCEDFYQDLPWRPRSSDNLNECKRCECHNHSNKCHFDPAIFILSHNKSGGVCDDCQHNTMGQNCEICKANYYRNPRVSINHPDACIHCDCDPRGSEVLGGCESTGDAELGIEAGRCNCKKFVTGHRCDTCLPGYWNLDERNPHGCEPCACNAYGTVAGHQCEYQAGECRCKRFVTGRTCDSCLPGYWNFGRDEEGCTACNCDIGGAYDSQCNARTGQCRCRPNIIGQHCNHVARDHYYAFLDWLLYEAEEASERGVIIYKDRLSGGGYVTWTGVGYTKVMGGSSLTFVVDNIPHSMEYDFLLRHDSKQVLHPWEGLKMTIERSGRANERSGCANTTPQDYNKVFTIQPDTTHSFVRPGTCLEKGVRYTITFKFPAQRYALDGKESHIFIDSLVLLPGSTGHPLNQKPEVYEQFKRQRCMETYYSPVRQFRESDICRRLVFSSSVAIHDGAKSCDCDLHGSFSPSCEVAGGQCKCKPNVIGRRCDKCAPGFYGLTYTGCMACDCHSHGSMSPVCDQRTGQCPCNTNSFGLKCSSCQRGFWGFPNCRKCSCNGRADECDQVTGKCIGCRSNSGGPYCDGCADGYYGDLKTGCQRCPCEHGGSCRWDPRSNQVVCDCPTGYTGPRCDRCAENFYGDPTYPDGTCQMCKCNNNIDPAVPGSCDSHTGQCTKCLYNTEGGSCERCKAGYYGDALSQNCKACVCNVLGTHAHLRNDCDRVTGQCHCLSNVFGRSCDQCGENFWKLADGRGCEPCNCDPYGSLSQKCNDIDGQCQCRRDFGGRQCNQCAENFWGDPRSSCKECMCDVGGSVSQQCDRHTGACTCNPGVTGHLCDRCARGTTGSLPHCKPCGPCYDGWLKLIGDITSSSLNSLK